MKRASTALCRVCLTTLAYFLCAAGPLARAESVTYSAASGKNAGKVELRGSSQTYYAPNGAFVMSARSSSVGSGDATFYSSSGRALGKQTSFGKSQVSFKDASGSARGSATRTYDGFTYYDSAGRMIGREVHYGSTAYFYDSSGRFVERASIWAPPSSSSPPVKADSATKSRESDSATANPTPIFSKRLFEPLATQKK
ncbi:MAG: hypothetical protein ACPL7D_04435 [Candidatus Sumerlaeaceae bacterium]